MRRGKTSLFGGNDDALLTQIFNDFQDFRIRVEVFKKFEFIEVCFSCSKTNGFFKVSRILGMSVKVWKYSANQQAFIIDRVV